MDDNAMGASEATSSEELLTFEDALKFLGTSKTTQNRLVEQGDLKGTRVGRQWRFRRAELQSYMERGPVAVAAPAQDVANELAFFAQELQRLSAPLPEERTTLTDIAERAIWSLTDHIIAFAIAIGASDIHLEPEKSFLRLRLRISGVLQVIREMPHGFAEPMAACVKQLSDMNVTERRLPQDGRFPVRYHDREFDLRVSCLPSLGGEGMVMRVLDRSSVLIGLDQLGILPEGKARLEEWLHLPHGIIIATGPTGSGKSTLLYSCLRTLNRPEIKILTVEDPIEYQLSGTRQVAVNKKLGLTFANLTRTFLRQDPDVLMVGEVRDGETASLIIEAALTGHLVLTALHTEDSVSALARLRDIDVETYLIADTIRGVIAQRLIRTVCSHCKTTDEITLADPGFARIRAMAEKGGYRLPEEITLVAGQGCPACRNSGYRGRTGLFELLTITPELMGAFKKGASEDQLIQIAVAQGMRTLLADGIQKAVEGITTVDEVLRVLGTAL